MKRAKTVSGRPDTCSFFLRYDPKTKTWTESNRIFSPNGNLQPAPVQITDDYLVAYCRPGGDFEPNPNRFVIRSESRDGGRPGARARTPVPESELRGRFHQAPKWPSAVSVQRYQRWRPHAADGPFPPTTTSRTRTAATSSTSRATRRRIPLRFKPATARSTSSTRPRNAGRQPRFSTKVRFWITMSRRRNCSNRCNLVSRGAACGFRVCRDTSPWARMTIWHKSLPTILKPTRSVVVAGLALPARASVFRISTCGTNFRAGRRRRLSPILSSCRWPMFTPR